MNKKSLLMTGIATLLACATLGAAAEDKQLQSVLVRGDRIYAPETTSSVTRSPLPLQDTPIAVQSIGAEIIEDQQVDSLTEALRNVSGVQPVFFIGGAYERFAIRGFEQSAASYRNGVLQPLTRFHAANTQSVEVLKGPAAPEYGMSDPGGIINIVTRKPTAESQMLIEQSASSLDDYRTTLGVNGALNASGTLVARVDASYLNAHGFRELTDTEETFVAPSIAWTSEDTTISLTAEFDKSRRVYDAGVPALGDGILDVPIERTYNQKGVGDDYDNRLIDLSAEHELSKAWKLAAGYSDYSTKPYYRSVYAYNGNLQLGDETADRYAWYGPEDFNTRSAWFQLNGTLNTGNVVHHLASGVQYMTLDGKAAASETYLDTINLYDYRYSQSNIDLAAIEALPTDNFTSHQQDRSVGLFIQDQMVVNQRLTIQLGARYDRIEHELDSAYFSPVVNEERDDSQFSPRAGILYKLTPEVSVYASYSESFGPGFNYEPSALYEPETAKQYEIGLKSALLNNRLTATVAVFDLTKQNVPTPDPDIPNFTVAIGEARSRGLEVDVQGALTDNLSLLANYAYLDTEITKDFSGNEDNHLTNAPRHQGAVWLRYDLNRALPGLSFGGGAFAASSRYGDTANSYGDDGYVRWDAFAAYRFKVKNSAVTAQLNVLNLTDEEYYTMRARWTNIPAEPRSLVGSVSFEF